MSLALAPAFDLSQIPVVVVGGDGANWLDTAAGVFPQFGRQRDGFHLARDAARGWGPAAGAALYAAVRQGDQATAREVLALPPPRRGSAGSSPHPPPPPPHQRPPRPLPPPGRGRSGRPGGRATFIGQVATADAAVDWRRQVPPELVPPGARALGTMEGTKAHPLAKRMKRKGMAWRATGARAMAKARELVTNGTLAPWCRRPPLAPPAAAPPPRRFAAPGPLPWPRVACPAPHGPLTDPTAAILHRLDRGGRARHRLT